MVAAATATVIFFTGMIMVVVMMVTFVPTTSTATSLFRLLAATSSASPTTSARLRLLSNEHNFESDFLKGELVAGAAQKFHGATRRLMGRAQLNSHRLFRKMGKALLHLSVENERNIGVELLLKLVKLLFSMLPRASFKHRQHENVLPCVVGKGVEHPRTLNSRSGRGWIGKGQIFAEGNHT